ncbi:MAG: hypothetical protein JO157_02470 [Acetobacteraceae bacterium]|nr:hypothetical protein [Acetobacteraceae bacterium]
MSDQSGGGSVTLNQVFRLLQEIRDGQHKQRSEQRDMRSLLLAQVELLALVDQERRTERRLGEVDRLLSKLRDDLGLMLKAELMGRVAPLEAKIDHRFDELADRISKLEEGKLTMQRPNS